ncbi:MAG: aspartate kinase [Flavobacteriales bacterium]|nr:aspartate kinase [Flavobacteriales bacterium]MCW8912542.1 aspartate kinase [Flavobacteriales bacterium]MCW8937548.1 aspartate kinase [Flavobacteriales bacterium]MCW8941416.1 aspartate kinase [Flavobacteriales bacterium]MCW8968540.1 aspartate kinase [Flavobacteriales bacterium]
MLVLKFGGTSVGSATRMKEVANLINTPERKIVVLSAMAGTTNSLVEIAGYLYQKNIEAANEQINLLEKKYEHVIDELFASSSFKEKGLELIKSHFSYVRAFTQDMFTLFEEKAILAQGEMLSTALFHYYLEEQKISSSLISALNFMRIDEEGEPNTAYIKEHIQKELAAQPSTTIFITQGFICRNTYGEIDNLKRGGSDYSASLIGAATNAEEIQIWTDIDGFHNNDPRIVENTKPLSGLSFDEAAELAYFGAKILHPSSVLPAKLANIPVRLKNTMQPEAPGTIICNETQKQGIKAIAAKDGITAIKIKSGRMLLAHGFLRKVFEIFETYKTSIDMITTSEVAVSVTIDDTKFLNEIVQDLKKFGTVEVDKDLSIICVVGDFIAESKGYALQIFGALKNIPIRMISYGGSFHNVSVLVNTTDKKEALQSLHNTLF